MTFSERSLPFLMKMAWSFISQIKIPRSMWKNSPILRWEYFGKLPCIPGAGTRPILESIWGRIPRNYGSGFEAEAHFRNMSTSSWWIEKPHRAQITMNDPYEGVREGWRTHFVHVPGVLFMMALGKTVDESVRAISIMNAGNPINISDALTEKVEQLMVETLRQSHKTQAYLRAKAKADIDRKTKS